MQFTLAAAAQPEAAQLFVCTEAGQLNDETAQLLCHSLEEKDSFAETKLPVSGSLKSIAVLRFADLATETLQKAAKEAAAWGAKTSGGGGGFKPVLRRKRAARGGGIGGSGGRSRVSL